MTLIDEILNKAKADSDAAEVFQTSSETTSCAWSADKLKLAEAKESSGIALRVLIDGKVGFFATSKIDDPDFIVKTACDLAPLGSEFAGELPAEFKPADVDSFDEDTAKVDAGKLVTVGNDMVGKARDANSDAIYDAKLDRSVITAEIANSNGARATFEKTIFYGYLYGSITREGDVLGIYEFDHSGAFSSQPDEWVDLTVRKLKDASNVVTIPAGEYPCILTPKALDILGPLQSALNARMVLKDMSPYKDKVGEQVFDPRINIDDDGLYGNMPGTQPVDDEGITSQVTPLIEKGVLKGFIHDLHTASKMGVEPTGNGMRAGLSANPRAGYSTLVFRPGDKTLEELIAGIEKGVLVDQIMGAHQASPFSGDFSVSVNLGYVIENGKIIGRFKDGMLAGNVFRMLKDQVLEIGSELKYTGVLAPPILLDKMTVATGG